MYERIYKWKEKKLFFLRRFWPSRAIGKSNFLASPKLRGKSSPNATHSSNGVQSITGTITTNYDAAPLQETPKRKSQIPITRKNGACLQPRGLTSSTVPKIGFFANSRTLSVGAAAEADGGCHRRTATDLDAILCVVWKRTGEPFAREAVPPQQQLATVAS